MIAHDLRRTLTYAYKCKHCHRFLCVDFRQKEKSMWLDPILGLSGRDYKRASCDIDEFMLEHYNRLHHDGKFSDHGWQTIGKRAFVKIKLKMKVKMVRKK